MTLVEAFRNLAPLLPGAEPRNAATVEEAARVLMEEVQRQLRKHPSFQRADVEDATQIMFVRLLQNRKPGLEAGPPTDAAVRAYIWRAAVQNAISLFRQSEKYVSIPDLESTDLDAAGGEVAVLEGLDRGAASDEFRAALEQLREELVPALSSSDASAFEQMVRLAQGDLDFQEVVEEELNANAPTGNPSSSDWKRARDRIYARHKRCRDRLLAGIRSRHETLGEQRSLTLELIMTKLLKRRDTGGQ